MYCYVVGFWFNWIFSSSQGSQHSGSSLSLASTKVCSMDEEEGPISDGKKSNTLGWFRYYFSIIKYTIIVLFFIEIFFGVSFHFNCSLVILCFSFFNHQNKCSSFIVKQNCLSLAVTWPFLNPCIIIAFKHIAFRLSYKELCNSLILCRYERFWIYS